MELTITNELMDFMTADLPKLPTIPKMDTVTSNKMISNSWNTIKLHAVDDIENTKENNKLKGRVLIVDDNDTLRELLAESVSDYGIYIETAINGIDALEKIQETQFDVMITDLQMPLMNGEQLVKELRNKAKQNSLNIPKIVVLTGSVDSSSTNNDIKEQSVFSLCDAHLQKPYETYQLYNLLEGFLQ
jgi:CheY-like chemotaxis protein